MENKIKAGDKVRVSKDAPRMYVPYWRNEKFCATLIVKEVNDGNASVLFEGENPYKTVQRIIPTKYLIKVDAEAKEEKFKYQVGQKVILHFYGGEVSTITEAFRDGGVWNKYILKMLPNHVWNENELEPYTEPKEQTDAENQAITLGEWVVTPYGYGVVGKDIEGRIAVALEYGGFCGIDKAIKIIADNPVFDWDAYAANLAKEMEGCDNIVSIKEKIRNLHRENNQGLHFNPFRCNNFANAVGESDYWKHYASNLAKEVALKVSYKYTDPKEAAEYAVLVAKAVVEGLKRR